MIRYPHLPSRFLPLGERNNGLISFALRCTLSNKIPGKRRRVMAVSTREAREHFSDVINRVAYGKERVILTRRGKPLVAVVPIADVELLETLEDKLDLEDALASLREAEETGTTSLERLKQELGL
jgi:prevent-host-death family protein